MLTKAQRENVQQNWGVGKNIKSDDMDAILRKFAQRQVEGRDSVILYRNGVVPEQKLHRRRRDLKVSDKEIALKIRAASPRWAEFLTPPPTPPPETPQTLKILEQMVQLYSHYVDGWIDGRIWIIDDEFSPGPSAEVSKTNLQFTRACDIIVGTSQTKKDAVKGLGLARSLIEDFD